jgi:hypothetical protein
MSARSSYVTGPRGAGRGRLGLGAWTISSVALATRGALEPGEDREARCAGSIDLHRPGAELTS